MEFNAYLVIKIIKFVLKVLFSLTCFCLAGYMIFLQFQAYIANEDSSVVSYKAFSHDNTDVYPVFTICLAGLGGTILRKSFNQSFSNTYYKTMMGKLEDRDNLTLIAFEDNVIQLLPIINTFRKTTKEGKTIYYIKQGSPLHKSRSHSLYRKSLFSTTYHDARHVCYTKDRNLDKDWLLRRHNMDINAEQMMRNGYEFHFYIHKRGQLLRKLGTPDYVLKHKMITEKEHNFTYDVTLSISSVDVLRKRPNAVHSCNPELYDEDSVWLNITTNMLDVSYTHLTLPTNREV